MVMQTDLNMLAISVSSSGVCGKVIHCLDQPPLNPCQKPNVAWHKPPVALIKHSNLQIKFERNIFFSLKKKRKKDGIPCLISMSSKTPSNFALLTLSRMCFQTWDIVTFFPFVQRLYCILRQSLSFIKKHEHAQAYAPCARAFYV